jgi:hypothetical protein
LSPYLTAAAVLAVLLGAAHSYLGERFILIRLFRREDLPRLLGSVEFTKQTLRFAWHLTTVAFIGLAAILLVASSNAYSPSLQIRIVAVTFAVSGVIAMLATRGKHLSWIVFFTIAALAWAGQSR